MMMDEEDGMMMMSALQRRARRGGAGVAAYQMSQWLYDPNCRLTSLSIGDNDLRGQVGANLIFLFS